MKFNAIIVAAIVFLAGCAQGPQQKTASAEQSSSPADLVEKGYQSLTHGSPKQAIESFDAAISHCQKLYPKGKKRVYASRGAAESLSYMITAAVTEQDAIAVDTSCSDALYFRGYTALDFGDIELAQDYIQQAVDMAPSNSLYLSELGHIHQTKQQWAEALRMFKKSEEAAESFSPEGVKNKELARAKRGISFNLIELGEFDEAESKLKECIVLDANDKGALNELQYLQKLRQKSAGAKNK